MKHLPADDSYVMSDLFISKNQEVSQNLPSAVVVIGA